MKRIKWTDRMNEILIKEYANTLTVDLAEKLEVSIYTLRNRAWSLGLKKDPEFIRQLAISNNKLSENGKNFRFKKGHIPRNKGLKQCEYMSPEKIEKSKQTRFSLGHIPVNHRPVGSERVTADGYIEVKIAEGLRQWKLKHRLVWEAHHGKIPPGYNVQFTDGNSKNCNIDNLYLITRKEQMKTKNSMHVRYPDELKKVIQLKGVLKRHINKIESSK